MASVADPPQTPNKTKQTKSSYRPEIDGLRAFAVIAVIINHFNKDLLPGGYLGVDIFFVISGYVITSSLSGRESKNFGDFLSGFYERRIKRLVPALSVFILITSIAICLFNPEPGLSLRTGLTSLFGLSNLYLLKQSTDYFAPSTELNVFTHTWSLGVEEQFYILFPFLIWFSGFGRQTKNGARNLFLMIGALTIASLVGFLYLFSTNQPAAYFLMPLRFWEMAAGCLIFTGFQKHASIEQFLEKVPPLLLLAMIVGVMYLPMSLAATHTIAVVALSSVLIASLKKETAAFKVFTNPKVVYLGLVSYSLYLWHWGVLSISRWTIGIHWWSVPLQIALMLALAVASYRWIETPLRKSNWFGKRWKTLVVGTGVLVTLSGGLVALSKPLKGKLYAGKKPSIAVARTNDWRNDIRLGATHLSGENCHADIYYAKAQLDTLFEKCKIPTNRTSRNQRTVAFLGDSHALSLMTAEGILLEAGLRIIHYSHSGCPFPNPPYGINPKECEDFNSNAYRHIFRDLQPGDTIVVYNYHLSHLGGKELLDTRHNILNQSRIETISSNQKIDLFIQGLAELAEKASRSNISVILIGSAQRNNEMDLRDEWFRMHDPATENLSKEVVNARKLNRKLLSKASDLRLKNLTFVDPLEILDKECGKDLSSFQKCFRDSDHMTDKSASQIILHILKNTLR